MEYRPIENGINQGMMAVHVSTAEFNKKSDVDLLYELFRIKRGPGKTVLLNATDPVEHDLRTFVKSLKDNSWGIQAVVNGMIYYPWLDDVNTIIVRNEGGIWSGFNCNEYRMLTDGDSELFEPTLPGDLNRCRLFVETAKMSKYVLDFVLNSKHIWGILA